MRDWAEIIRLEGNTAAHGEEEFGESEFTRENANQLSLFTELFLIYAFTLPARVKEYHKQTKTEMEGDLPTPDTNPIPKPNFPQLFTD